MEIRNKCFRAVRDLLKEFDAHRLPWILENPHSSKCWHLRFLKRLARQKHVQTVVVDFCQFGTSGRKRTRLLCGNIDNEDLHRLRNKICSSNTGICSATGKPHWHLSGPNPQGIPWTLIAQPYPHKLCSAFAYALTANKHHV